MKSPLAKCLPVLAILFLFAGCGSGPETGLVTGVVTLNNKPLENASVSFFPSDGRASGAKTNSEGKYELIFTRDQKGAIVGGHRVTISREDFVATDYTAEQGDIDEEDKEIEKVPEKYGNPETSGLTAEVASGENEFNFDLKSDE